MILKVGLTGGMAAGKSTIARTFAGLGCFVIDADQVVNHLYRPGSAGFKVITERYGKEILSSDGQIDRMRLSQRALATPEGAAELNALIHPLVAVETQRLLDEEQRRFPGRDRIAVLEASLILEGGSRDNYDKIIVVDLPKEQQLVRALGRGMRREEAQRRIERQWNREQRLLHADYVIHNEGDPRATEVETHEVHRALVLDLADKKRRGASETGEARL